MVAGVRSVASPSVKLPKLLRYRYVLIPLYFSRMRNATVGRDGSESMANPRMLNT